MTYKVLEQPSSQTYWT